MSTNDYIKRRIGILDENSVAEYGSVTMQDIQKSINSANFFQKLAKKASFNNLASLSVLVYFINALIQIEFRSHLSPARLYFLILDCICLFIILVHSSILIYSKIPNNISQGQFVELLGIIIACLLFIFDASKTVASESVLYKVCSIIRFLILLSKVEVVKNKHNRRHFSIIPFKTNLERLLNLLNTLRTLEWIHTDTQIDRELAWSIRCICTQTLYNVEVQTENKEQEEIIKWAMSERPHWELKSPVNKEFTLETNPVDLNDTVKQCLEKSEKLGFDIFKLKEASNSNELAILATHLFTKFEVFRIELISRKKFASFIKAIQSGYLSELPYHNSTHAADVVQAFNYYLIGCEIKDSYNYSLTDYAICILSACIHDYQHPGRTNAFLMNTKSKLAVLYNDISVLENHHVASCFKLMYENDSNILDNMTFEKASRYRSLMIELVLATDFSKHFKELAKFKLRFGKENEGEKSKNSMLKMLMHAADVSNSTRKWSTYYEWAQRVLREFFSQGDEERELGITISPLCDRNTVNFAKSQIGFIDLFIMPIFGFLSEIDQNFHKCKKNVEKNRNKLLNLPTNSDPDQGHLIS